MSSPSVAFQVGGIFYPQWLSPQWHRCGGNKSWNRNFMHVNCTHCCGAVALCCSARFPAVLSASHRGFSAKTLVYLGARYRIQVIKPRVVGEPTAVAEGLWHWATKCEVTGLIIGHGMQECSCTEHQVFIEEPRVVKVGSKALMLPCDGQCNE